MLVTREWSHIIESNVRSHTSPDDQKDDADVALVGSELIDEKPSVLTGVTL